MSGEQVTIYDVMAEREKKVTRIVAAAKRKKSKSQADRIIEFLNRYGSITQKDANEMGIFRLAARVYDINNSTDPRYAGVHIIQEPDYAENQYGEKVTFARYRLVV